MGQGLTRRKLDGVPQSRLGHLDPVSDSSPTIGREDEGREGILKCFVL